MFRFTGVICDEVEIAILESGLPTKKQDLVLHVYQVITGRNSLEKAQTYRLYRREDDET